MLKKTSKTYDSKGPRIVSVRKVEESSREEAWLGSLPRFFPLILRYGVGASLVVVRPAHGEVSYGAKNRSPKIQA